LRPRSYVERRLKGELGGSEDGSGIPRDRG